MKRGPLWKISVPVTPATEDAVTEALSEALRTPASIYEDLKTGRALASVYLEKVADWTDEARAGLATRLAFLSECGLSAVRLRPRVTRLRREDWAESWKRHFKPMEFGRDLLVKPSWSQRRPRAGQALVVLDPGLSFGTGQHPTTRFCLEQIVAHYRESGLAAPNLSKGGPAAPKRREGGLLDMGTGSGILAIAAAKLGYGRVEAFDFDPDAVRIARANADRNSVRRRVAITCRDLTSLAKTSVSKYDVICANLVADLLIAERDRIVTRLRPGGTLVLAGILAPQFPDVSAAYAKTGLRLIGSRREREWKSGAFRGV